MTVPEIQKNPRRNCRDVHAFGIFFCCWCVRTSVRSIIGTSKNGTRWLIALSTIFLREVSSQDFFGREASLFIKFLFLHDVALRKATNTHQSVPHTGRNESSLKGSSPFKSWNSFTPFFAHNLELIEIHRIRSVRVVPVNRSSARKFKTPAHPPGWWGPTGLPLGLGDVGLYLTTNVQTNLSWPALLTNAPQCCVLRATSCRSDGQTENLEPSNEATIDRRWHNQYPINLFKIQIYLYNNNVGALLLRSISN